MGEIVVYILEWSVCLLSFLLLYKMCFSGSTFHRFNRLFLLGSVVLSAILPLIHVELEPHEAPVAETIRVTNSEFATQLKATDFSVVVLPEVPEEHLTTDNIIALVLIAAYIIYILVMVVGWTKSFIKMFCFIHGKRSRKVNAWVRLVSHSEQFGPFSWMNCIVVSDQEEGFARKASIRHELAHVTHLHYLDLMFLLLCTLVCPVCWLVMKELKVVHEYEADDEVINRYHIQSRDYQRLLIQRTVGAEAYALASSFNLNIKNRIIMMKKKQSTWWRILWIAITLPLMGIALTAFSKPKEVLKATINEAVPEQVNNLLHVSTPESAEIIETIETDEPVMEEQQPEKMADDKNLMTGKVIEKDRKSERPIAGANIFEIDAKTQRIVARGIVKEDGTFSFSVKNPKDKIRISHVGYKTQEVDFANNLDIVLEANTGLKGVMVYDEQPTVEGRTGERYQDTNNEGKDNEFFVLEKMPEFPGGLEALNEYLKENLKYPAIAKENFFGGTYRVKFTVDKTGLVRNPQIGPEIRVVVPGTVSKPEQFRNEVNKDLTDEEKTALEKEAVSALKEEAIHVVRNMPRWEPGRQNGKRVDMDYTVEICFYLR